MLAACTGGGAALAPAPSGPRVDAMAAVRDSRLHLDAAAPVSSSVPVAGGAGEVAQVALVSVAGRRMGVQALCEGPARLRELPEPTRRMAQPRPDPAWAPAGTSLGTGLSPGSRGRVWLDMAPGTEACRLTVRAGSGPGYTLELTREERFNPALAALDAGAPRCAPAAGTDPLSAAFHAGRPLSQTCPMPPGPIRLLPDAIEGFDAKVEALTGGRLGAQALESGDPWLPLDFSQAPELDLIVVSYLNFNADFTGFLMARMLAFHAARGTVVRIFVADPLWSAAERGLFERLAARHPTIQLLPFRYAPRRGDGLEAHLGRIHRVQHVKLFATLARVPGRSRALIGGRNHADGYVFPAPFDLSAWPLLRDYRLGRGILAGGFHSYSDLEAEFRGESQVRALVAQWAGLWRDETGHGPATPAARGAAAAIEGPLMRGFLSVPWEDGQAQVALFADLINAAQTRIDIVSPYLNPPEAVARALDAAIARGVVVRVLTTERVREPADTFITGLNRQFADRYAGRLAYLDHDPYPLLLHTKAMVIDGRLTLIGSTNLNMRSFVHDLENGVMLLDEGFAARITDLIEGYAADASPIAPGGEVALAVRLLLRWPMVRRLF